MSPRNPQGTFTLQIERPVPLVGEPEDGWSIYTAEAEVYDGRLDCAHVLLPSGSYAEVRLMDSERELVESDAAQLWAEEQADRRASREEW